MLNTMVSLVLLVIARTARIACGLTEVFCWFCNWKNVIKCCYNRYIKKFGPIYLYRFTLCRAGYIQALMSHLKLHQCSTSFLMTTSLHNLSFKRPVVATKLLLRSITSETMNCSGPSCNVQPNGMQLKMLCS